MDPKSLTIGAIAGTAIWEIGKIVIAAVFKRANDVKESKRKMLCGDIEELASLILSINEISIAYYATEFGSDKATSLSHQIKAKSKTAGIKLAAINSQLSAAGKPHIPIARLTCLRNAATKHLDVKRSDLWGDDDPRLNEIHRAAHLLHTELNKARFSTV